MKADRFTAAVFFLLREHVPVSRLEDVIADASPGGSKTTEVGRLRSIDKQTFEKAVELANDLRALIGVTEKNE